MNMHTTTPRQPIDETLERLEDERIGRIATTARQIEADRRLIVRNVERSLQDLDWYAREYRRAQASKYEPPTPLDSALWSVCQRADDTAAETEQEFAIRRDRRMGELADELHRTRSIIAGYEAQIRHLDAGLERARLERDRIAAEREARRQARLAADARQKTLARVRVQMPVPHHPVRVNRNTRARRAVRTVARLAVKSTADPDGPAHSTHAAPELGGASW